MLTIITCLLSSSQRIISSPSAAKSAMISLKPTFQTLPFSLIIFSLGPLTLVFAKNNVTLLNFSCTGRGIYPSGGTFEENLYLLLSNLTFYSQRTKFYTFTAGETTDHPSYGLFLCRGDVSSQICHECVTAAASSSLQQCSYAVAGVIWYDECTLRYSDQSNYTIVMMTPVRYYQSGPLDYVQYDDEVSKSFKDLIASASNGDSSLSFAGETVNVTSSLTLRSYVECIPDMSRFNCEKCLDAAIVNFRTDSNGSEAAALLQPSCRLMYEFSGAKTKRGRVSPYLVLLLAVSSASLLTGLLCVVFFVCKRKGRGAALGMGGMEMESLQFDFATIKHLTQNFSQENQIGRGGFGVVYKGSFSNGHELAIKRLSIASKQGMQEFKAEVSLLARLQHRNLVKLHGFCAIKEEKLLVYELLPNKSLDRYLADRNKISNLNWETRYKIILGVARGMQYLHDDSRLRIIHRDLKSSNILLDADLEPKISDFGLAKLFELHQTLGNTSTISGTYGYMAPEYARTGQYSTKSDVYSFGVILLEMLSGKMRSSSYLLEEEGFLSLAWRLWTDRNSSEFLDFTIIEGGPMDEASRCVQIGLLCVQEDPSKRPDMAFIVSMLNHPSIIVPIPTAPLSSIWSSASTSTRGSVDKEGASASIEKVT